MSFRLLFVANWFNTTEAAHPCCLLSRAWPCYQQCLVCCSCCLIHSHNQRLHSHLSEKFIVLSVSSLSLFLFSYSSGAFLQCCCISVHTWATDTFSTMAVTCSCCHWLALLFSVWFHSGCSDKPILTSWSIQDVDFYIFLLTFTFIFTSERGKF